MPDPKPSALGDLIVLIAAILVLWIGGSAALVTARAVDRAIMGEEYVE